MKTFNSQITNHSKALIKSIFATFLCCMFLCSGEAASSVRKDSILTDPDQEVEFSFLQFGLDYSTNTSMLGQLNTTVKQPSLNVYTGYFGKRGLELSVMVSNVWNSDLEEKSPTLTSNVLDSDLKGKKSTQELELTLGYSFDPFKWMSLNVAYSHYILDKESNTIKSMYSDLFQLNVFNEIKWWQLNFGAGYTLGNRKELFLNAQTGVNINITLSKISSLIIQPSFGMYASNMEYFDVVNYQNFWYLHSYAKRNPEKTIGDFTSQVKDSPNYFAIRLKNYWDKNPDEYRKLTAFDSGQVMWEMFQPVKKFTFTNINFNFPIYWYMGDFMVSTLISTSKSINLPSYIEENWITYLSVGVSYSIGW